jgi:CDP-paratose 2-epimerase
MTRVLVTGGAGFIGSNLAHRLISEGHSVTIFDSLSRHGGRSNLKWLKTAHGPESFRLVEGDVADFESLLGAAEGAERVYHLAGQVAVTTSVTEPRADFLSNALGSFNVLEACRLVGNDPVVLYSSTNKVYGELDVEIAELPTRYAFVDLEHGVSESQPIDFHSPYGCSKGCGDQYVRDYHRIYGLRTVVLRQSCIYGYRQFGIEDQGWVAWFCLAALRGDPISIYGDGKQVRDVLFIDDLLDVYDAAVSEIDRAAGQIYNVGGGPANTLSIWREFGPLLESLVGRTIPVVHGDRRPGDQPIYVSDIRKAQRELNWSPKIGVDEGVRRLVTWISANQHLFPAHSSPSGPMDLPSANQDSRGKDPSQG